jgi:hypothetical protein
MNEGMHGCKILRSEGNPIDMRRVNIVEGIESSFHVARRGFMAVQGKKGMGSNKVRPSGVSKPADAANKTLIGLFPSNLGQRVVVVG